PEGVADILADPERSLEELPGIGSDLAAKIRTIVDTESLPQLEELRSQVPRGVVEMMRLPGLGPKKAAALFKELQIASLESLKAAAESGTVAQLKGFGEKTAKKILEGLGKLAQAGPQRVLLAEALPAAEAILADLRDCPGVHEAELAGSFRRRRETVADLDL